MKSGNKIHQKIHLEDVDLKWTMFNISGDIVINFNSKNGEQEYTLVLTYKQLLYILYKLVGKMREIRNKEEKL